MWKVIVGETSRRLFNCYLTRLRKGIIFFSIKSTRFRKVIILRENYKKRIFFSGWKAKFNLEKFEL